MQNLGLIHAEESRSYQTCELSTDVRWATAWMIEGLACLPPWLWPFRCLRELGNQDSDLD
jgi:hypothetical protein